MSDGLQSEFNIDEFIVSIEKFDEKTRAGLLLISQQVCKLMQNWAKVNASWTDRTGNARRGLTASAKWEDYISLVISMSHKVDYGSMLELAYEKKYSILKPALEQYKNEFIDQWTNMLNELGGN